MVTNLYPSELLGYNDRALITHRVLGKGNCDQSCAMFSVKLKTACFDVLVLKEAAQTMADNLCSSKK